MATIRAGTLRTRLVLEEEVRTDDGQGGAALSFRPLCHVWADLRSANTRAGMEAKKLNPKLTHLVRLRYRPGITPDMRFVLGTRAFRIDSVVDPDDTRTVLEAWCEELVA